MRRARQFLLFLLVNLALIGGYAAALFPVSAARMALVAAPFVICQYPLMLLARTWAGRVLWLAVGWLAFLGLVLGPWGISVLPSTAPGLPLIAIADYLLRRWLFDPAEPGIELAEV